jgi:hypothetical protein
MTQSILGAVLSDTNLVMAEVFSQFECFVKDFATPEEYTPWGTLSTTYQTSDPSDLANAFAETVRPMIDNYIQFRSSIAALVTNISGVMATFPDSQLPPTWISAMNQLQNANPDPSVREMVANIGICLHSLPDLLHRALSQAAEEKERIRAEERSELGRHIAQFNHEISRVKSDNYGLTDRLRTAEARLEQEVWESRRLRTELEKEAMRAC